MIFVTDISVLDEATVVVVVVVEDFVVGSISGRAVDNRVTFPEPWIMVMLAPP